MSSNREMKKNIKQYIVPLLLAWGFTGKYPEFERTLGDQIDGIDFQIGPHPGMLTVNLGRHPKEDDKIIEQGLRIFIRLGAGIKNNHTDHWFIFQPDGYDLYRLRKGEDLINTLYLDAEEKDKYSQIIDDINLLLDKQAEPWWEETRNHW